MAESTEEDSDSEILPCSSDLFGSIKESEIIVKEHRHFCEVLIAICR